MSLIFESHRILDEKQSARLFNTAFIVSQCFGIFAVMSVAIWMGAYEDGGYAWNDDPQKQFHYHPTMVTIGLIFLQGEAILVYRVFRKERKSFTKLLHLITHSVAFIFTLVAIRAVWNAHSFQNIPHLYSIHSWVGISTVTFYVVQYIGGFVTFFFPGLAIEVRKFVLPFHQLFGLLIFLATMTAALMGITENSAWKNDCWTKYHEMCGRQLVSNLLGISVIGYCASVVFIVANPRWKRMPLPEEESLNVLGSDQDEN